MPSTISRTLGSVDMRPPRHVLRRSFQMCWTEPSIDDFRAESLTEVGDEPARRPPEEPVTTGMTNPYFRSDQCNYASGSSFFKGEFVPEHHRPTSTTTLENGLELPH